MDLLLENLKSTNNFNIMSTLHAIATVSLYPCNKTVFIFGCQIINVIIYPLNSEVTYII